VRARASNEWCKTSATFLEWRGGGERRGVLLFLVVVGTWQVNLLELS
jgi:hypothetical protein